MRFIQFAFLLFFFYQAWAEKTQTFNKNGYTLIFTDQDSGLPQATMDAMVDRFLTVYPKEVKEYKPSGPKTAYMTIDPTLLTAPAEVVGNKMRYSAGYFKLNPKDIDIVSHQAMHILLGTVKNAPTWLVEGIADYGRWKFGTTNAAAGFYLPIYEPEEKYTDSYFVTAAFLHFIEKSHPGAIKCLFDAVSQEKYTPAVWKKLTKKTLDQNWSDYARSDAPPKSAAKRKPAKKVAAKKLLRGRH